MDNFALTFEEKTLSGFCVGLKFFWLGLGRVQASKKDSARLGYKNKNKYFIPVDRGLTRSISWICVVKIFH